MFNDKTLASHYGKTIKDLNKNSKKAFNKNQHSNLPSTEITYKTNFHVKIDTLFDKNVIGYIEGTDLKDEVLIICGHYDHVGRGPKGMNLGADDNASGTAGVMELARLCAQAQSNGFEFRRSVVFIAFAAEELGLNGSFFYVNNPIFPLDKTVMVINMDMIGRSDNKHENPGYVYTWPIGRHAIKRPTKKLLRSVDKQFENTHFYLKKKFPENLMWFAGSDHFPFYKKGVPALIVSTGTHDDYHKPTDTADKINYENMANVIKALFVLTTDIASSPEKYPLKK
jgi:Zn-dependent M28 family amino/carboxypeptidase